MPLGRLSVLPSRRADQRDTAGHHEARAPTNSFSLIKSLMIVVSLLDCSTDTGTFTRWGIRLVHSRVRRAAHVGSLRCRSVLGRKSNSPHKVACECRDVYNAELAGNPSAYPREPRTRAGAPSQTRGLASGFLLQSNRQWPRARPQPRR